VEYVGGTDIDPMVVPIPIECPCDENNFWPTPPGSDPGIPDCFCGCTDPLAVNYDSQATFDNNTCIYNADSGVETAVLHTRKMILKLVNTKINLSIR
jgi:hypothetical protein